MVVWAEVKSIGEIWFGEISREDAFVQFVERGFVPVEINVGIRGGGDASDLYKCWIYPFSNAKYAGVGDARGYYFVEEITIESIDATLAEIEKSINKLWGNDWYDVSSRVSWFGIGEFEFIYEKDEPVLNPDGTINYNANAYMSCPPVDFSPEEVEYFKNQDAYEAARSSSQKEGLN